MDDKVKDGMFDDEGQIFPETETRRLAERFAPKNPITSVTSVPTSVLTPRTLGIGVVEQALRQEPERPLLKSLRATLDDRQKTHGEFVNDARTGQRLKAVMRDTVKWGELTDVQCEALEHVATKIGRILSGDPNHKDHWSDIQGYARLVEERL